LAKESDTPGRDKSVWPQEFVNWHNRPLVEHATGVQRVTRPIMDVGKRIAQRLADNEDERMKCHTREPTSRHHSPALSCLHQEMGLNKFLFMIGCHQ